MQLIRSINSKTVPNGGCVLTIGNFDAVHIGHQAILEKLRARAQALGVPSVVMTFDPTPQEHFAKAAAPPRLTNLSSRFFALQRYGVDFMLALPFKQSMAQTSAEAFIEDYLVSGLKVRYLLVGDDFRFGAGRRGDYQLLQQFGQNAGFETDQFDTVTLDDQRVSSTYVRERLAEADFTTVEKLLNRKYATVGRVLHGDKRGRQWGFPTLNLAVKHRPVMTGVFAVSVKGLGDEVRGVANLGTRPTVGGMKTLLEVHLFDFSSEIYGQRICVEFDKKIREEKKFDSFDQLKAQIFKDVETAKLFYQQVRA